MHWNTFPSPVAEASSGVLKFRLSPMSEMNVAAGSSVVSVQVPSGWLRNWPPSPAALQPGMAALAAAPTPRSDETTPM